MQSENPATSPDSLQKSVVPMTRDFKSKQILCNLLLRSVLLMSLFRDLIKGHWCRVTETLRNCFLKIYPFVQNWIQQALKRHIRFSCLIHVHKSKWSLIFVVVKLRVCLPSSLLRQKKICRIN